MGPNCGQMRNVGYTPDCLNRATDVFRFARQIPKLSCEEVQYEDGIGIPNGRSSDEPGLGIQTRRVGLALEAVLRVLLRSSRSSGVSDFTPSTPAVFFPWLS